jgi:hypothetical protein
LPAGAEASITGSGLDLTPYFIGDMNPQVLGLDASDVEAFATALANIEGFRNTIGRDYGVEPVDAGDCDHSGSLDYDDIDDFVALFNGAVTVAQVYQAINSAQVPEPLPVQLAISAAASSLGLRHSMARIRRPAAPRCIADPI